MDVQRLSKIVKDQYESAQKYYQILSVLNDLQLAESEVQLMAFAAIKGNITESSIRKEFCDKHNTTVATINNMVYRLKKKNIIHKSGKTLFINPALTKIKFDEPVTLLISIKVLSDEPV